MVLKLYGHPLSTCTRRVAVVLHEKNVPFEFHSIDLAKGEHKSAEFLEKQPFGQVPYIDDDGFILYESRAIAYYVAKKWATQGTPLIPTELQAEALFQQASSIELMNFNDYAEKAVAEMIFKPMYGIPSDKAVFDKLIATLTTKLGVYDKILSKQKYLAGNEITLADLYHLPYGYMLPKAGSNVIDTKPNVKR
ncbi:thioredoxin-like protein [Pholiota conissans]|uniref:glutathione transferase n=1 Tax=Pholiota conissans TaxID=109636 RepID=A0A9P5YVL9_9AGAR|nr:thioredoxin-like protein [Pholiota conissans]